MANDILLFPGDEDWGDFPDDFTDDEMSDETQQLLKDIRAVVGAPLRPLVIDFSTLQQRGQAASLRGIRFTTGSDALIWLFRRGIFLFSNVVRMSDGTWAVSIRNSDPVEVDQEETFENDDDLIF